MNSIQELWGKRVKEYWNMAIRYLRLIGNSGFLFAIYIAIIAGSYYYSELLKWLPELFPATSFLAVVTALLLTRSRLRSFIKEGDLVFLSPIEGKLAAYFRASYYYSLILQSFVIVLVVVLLTPLYRHFILDDGKSILFVLVILIISKAWNLLAQWEESRLLFTSGRFNHMLGRFLINVTLTYLLFAGATIYFLIAIFLIKGLLLFFYYQHLKRQHSLKWEFLIETEERMVMSFYRIANMFTDVPKLSTKVSRRKPWSLIPNLLSLDQKSTFKYLYLKSFTRANDYFGVYVRLLLIGIVFVFYVQFDFGKVFISILFLYMSALQLSTLWNHHLLKIWIDLYPIDYTDRKKSFSTVVFSLLVVKTVVFTGATLLATKLNLIEPLLVLVIGMTVSYVYSFVLLHRKRNNHV
ncbi:ABC transporter permease [Anaerobacillus isosaccharinicus]|uniref:ABC transporter permease n=1 Tax=Anaerobacillus isosaccharinicus TaxID=1532552 RepID=A0A1S2KZU8_9BACI|nr:ABC transporter permease [Anaerobacillus isosaccharinicus]MBA5585321.1 ABC transporter permease [Anaerobacillus isosaccharinicus]QOY36353.1 ABC transporter permease [Anaerobacillus isosaccharinicus]